MKYDKSLKEVWEWKKKSYDELRGLTIHEMVVRIKLDAEKLRKKYRLRINRVNNAVDE